MSKRVLREIGRNPSPFPEWGGSEDRELLERPGLEVMYHEISNQWSTYVITALNKAPAVTVIYHTIFGET